MALMHGQRCNCYRYGINCVRVVLLLGFNPARVPCLVDLVAAYKVRRYQLSSFGQLQLYAKCKLLGLQATLSKISLELTLWDQMLAICPK